MIIAQKVHILVSFNLLFNPIPHFLKPPMFCSSLTETGREFHRTELRNIKLSLYCSNLILFTIILPCLFSLVNCLARYSGAFDILILKTAIRLW